MGAEYTGSFELRRLVLKFSRTPAGGTSEDAAAFTCHYAKLTGGAPDSNWLTADYTAVEGRWDTWWTAYKIYFPATFTFRGYTWYKDGPAWSPADRADGPANPATRQTNRAVAGTQAATSMLPPQLALTVTKVTDIRKRWGRLYMLAGSTGFTDNDGRLTAGQLATWLGLFVTCFNGCRADGKQPVIFSRGRSSHTAKRGGTIAAHGATAYEITGLQMDNLYDVVRSRRWSVPTVRTLTNLT
jgi:hypothetical protein